MIDISLLQLWEEIRGTRREFEIDGIELAMLESQEQIAAWKIKYYIQRYIEKKYRKNMEDEKRSWRKQGKAMQKKITTYQQEIEEYTSKNLESKNTQLQAHCVALSGQVNSLTEELTAAKSDISALHKKIREQAVQHEIKLEQKDVAMDDIHKAHALTKEELEISRRTCQDYVRNITLLEVQLQEIEREMRLRRMVNGEDFEKVAERNKELLEQVEAVARERDDALKELGKGDSVREEWNAQMAKKAEEYAALQDKYLELESENTHLNDRIQDMSARLEKTIMEKKSLERLVTETTVKLHNAEEQVQTVRKDVAEREAVISELEGVVNEREFEIEELKFRIFNGEECIQQANDFNEAIVQDNETLSMTVEDIEERYRIMEEQLLTSVEYSRMLEMQLFVSRQREASESARTTASPTSKMFPDPRYFSAPASFNAQFASALQQPEPNLDGEGSLARDALEEFSSVIDPFRSLSVVSHPLEERLSSLLIILEDKINQIDNVLETAHSRMGYTASSSRFGSKLEYEDWYQSRDDLEAALVEEKRRLENLKSDLSVARDDIHRMQSKKNTLKKEYRKALELEKSGPSPPAVGEEGSTTSEVVQDEMQKLDTELHQRLTEAQELATEALNCKLECERLRRELEATNEEVEAEARTLRLRSAPQLSATKPLTRADLTARPTTRQNSQENSAMPRVIAAPIPEASEEGTSVNSEAGDNALSAHDEIPPTIEEKEEEMQAEDAIPEQSDVLLEASAVSYAQIASAETSLFHQQSEANEAATDLKQDNDKDASSSIAASKPEIDESSVATVSVENASTVIGDSEVETAAAPKEEVHYEEDFEPDTPAPNNTVEGESSEVFPQGVSAEESVAEKSIASLAENSFASSTNAFRYHSQDLIFINSSMHKFEEKMRELKDVKEQRRRDIELWMLDFLKVMNRMPTLADSKYGTNRHLFVNFVQVQHEIIAIEDELESLSVRANQKLDDIADDVTLSEESRAQFANAFKDCILSVEPRTTWEDPFKLSFESVEQLLMVRNKLSEDGQSATDDDEDFRNRTESNVEDSNAYVHEIIDMKHVDEEQYEQLRDELNADIATMHDDLLELRDIIISAQTHTDDLNTQMTVIKNQIMKWTQDFRAEHGRSPTERDKMDNIAHLYDAYQDTRMLLDEEVEHMSYLADIARAKAADREKLKHLLRVLTKDADDMLVSRSLSSGGLQEASVGEIVRTISRDGNDANRDRQVMSAASSLDSDANGWKYIREGVEAELVKLNAELGILRSFLKTAENELSDLRAKKNEIKRVAKEWLDAFIKEHNRHPTAEEKNQHAENLYDEYAAVQEDLSDILSRREQATTMIDKMVKLIDAKNARLQEVVDKERLASRPATREYTR